MMTNALYEFAKRVQPGDAIEYIPCEDGSAIITALRGHTRVLSLVVESGHSDGRVYDDSKIDNYLQGEPGYIVYPPEEAMA